MALVFKELVNSLLSMYRIKNVSCKSDYHIKRLIQEMWLNSQLKLCNIFSCYTLIIQLKELLSDQKWVNLVELHREDHLTISVEFLEHLCIAIFETVEQYFDLLKNVLLWFRWINPFGEVVEELLFEKFSILLSSKICMDLAHTSSIRVVEALFHWAPIKIENKERR